MKNEETLISRTLLMKSWALPTGKPPKVEITSPTCNVTTVIGENEHSQKKLTKKKHLNTSGFSRATKLKMKEQFTESIHVKEFFIPSRGYSYNFNTKSSIANLDE